jgi:hypothetical protein
MREINPSAYGYNISASALDTALRAALRGKVVGISTYGPSQSISIFLDDSVTRGDEATTLATAAAHDPVILSADKLTITANGSDTATVTVNVPKPGASAVTLLVGGLPVPVTLTDGVGSIQITSADPATIQISVQNPENRTTDTLIVEAQ